MEFYNHREVRIRVIVQVAFAGVVDGHRAQQELMGLLTWVRDRWCLRLSPKDVDAHNENFMDPQAFLALTCPVRRRMRAERALVRLEQYFGSQQSASGTWPNEHGTKLERIMRRTRVRSKAVVANSVQSIARGSKRCLRTAR